MGFSRQEYWSGLLHCQPRASSAKTRGFHTQLDEGPEHFQDGRSKGMGTEWDKEVVGKVGPQKRVLCAVSCHSILQGIFLTQGSELGSPALQADSLPSDNSVRPRRWQPTRLHHPWDSPGKSTGVGCHCLLCLQCLGHGQRKAMPKNTQTTAQLHSSHTLVK